MKKSIKYVLSIAVSLLVIYFSFDIENLQEYQAKNTVVAFDAANYANQIWSDKLSEAFDESPDAGFLLKQLSNNPEQAFSEYGKKLGIAQTHYFMLLGEGTILSVEKEYLSVALNSGETIKIATAFIFGNGVRDGSGMVDINDFLNMTDFNNVSIELNKLVRSKVISRLSKAAETGKQIQFAGVAELRIDMDLPDQIRIIPVKANLSDGSKD